MRTFRLWLEQQTAISAFKRLKDINDRGDFNREELDQIINDLIKEAGQFAPSADKPSPAGGFFGAEEIIELAALVAGVKPAAWLAVVLDLMKQSGIYAYVVRKLLSMAQRRGLTYTQIDSVHGPMMVVAGEQTLRKLKVLIDQYMREQAAKKPSRVSLDVEIGRLLGYPPEAIKKFVDRAVATDEFMPHNFVHHNLDFGR